MGGPQLTEEQVWKGVGSAAKGAAALVAAIGVVWAALWWALQPRVDEYFDTKLAQFRLELVDISTKLTRIEQALPSPKPFVEFVGNATHEQGVYHAGETIELLYLLRRNLACPTTVNAQFWSYESNTVASELSYQFQATQAATSIDFGLFAVRIRVPEGMKPGVYSYAPLLIPSTEACPLQSTIQVPPSLPFIVEAKP